MVLIYKSKYRKGRSWYVFEQTFYNHWCVQNVLLDWWNLTFIKIITNLNADEHVKIQHSELYPKEFIQSRSTFHRVQKVLNKITTKMFIFNLIMPLRYWKLNITLIILSLYHVTVKSRDQFLLR